MNSVRVKATVFIPVYNGENDHLQETLSALFNQKTNFEWNVLIIDSGSKDNSVLIINEFASRYSNLTFVQIPNSEYSHGGTRQKAAEMSECEIMVYLSQDAVPANDKWLENMVRPFDITPKIVGVLGRQIPRSYCFPLQKKDIHNVFDAQGIYGTISLYDKNSPDFARASFYSDVCSAARRSTLINDVPYRNISYAEDQAFGRDIINRYYIKAFASEGIVIHSNDIRLSEYKGRILDELLGLEEVGIKLGKPSKKELIKQVTIQAFGDAMYAIKDKGYSLKQKIYYVLSAPIFRYARWQGMNLAFKHETEYSLEKKKK